MVVERPVAGGRRRAGEVERPQAPGRDLAADELDHVRVGALLARGRSRRRASRCRRRASASGAIAAAIAARVDGRQVALHVDHDVVPALRDRALRPPRRCGRSPRRGRRGSSPPRRPPPRPPRRWPGRRSRRRPGRCRPRRRGARHARSSARRRCRPAACPGSRVEAMRRAGMRTIGSDIGGSAAVLGFAGCLAGRTGRCHRGPALRREGRNGVVAKAGAMRLSSAAGPRAPHPAAVAQDGALVMDSFEVNKIAGARSRHAALRDGPQHLSGALFAPKKPGDAGYALPEAAAESATPPRPPPRPSRCRSSSPRPIRRRARPRPRSARPATPSRRAGRTRSARTSTASSDGPKAHAQGFNYSAALKGKGGNWNFEELDKFIHNPKGDIPGTIMAFAGLPVGGRARRCPRLSAHASPTARSRCRRLERAPRARRARRPGLFRDHCTGFARSERPAAAPRELDDAICARLSLRRAHGALLAVHVRRPAAGAGEPEWRHGALAARRAEVPGRLQAFRLRQPGRAEGRARAPRRPGHLRQLQPRRRRREGRGRGPASRSIYDTLMDDARWTRSRPNTACSPRRCAIRRTIPPSPIACARRRAGTTASR